MRLTLVIPALGSGGAERILSILANCWAERNHEVTILTLSMEAPFYELDVRVKWMGLGVAARSSSKLEALRLNARKLRILRNAIALSRPQVVVSFLDTTNILSCFATRGTGIPVVVSERTDPYNNGELPRIWRILRRISYLFAAKIIVQTNSVVERMRPEFGNRVMVIRNPVMDPGGRHNPLTASRKSRKWVVAMGRLSPEKKFDLLLEAFAELAGKHSEWSLRILGDGPLLSFLERKVETLGLNVRALLVGRTKRPSEALIESDLFVMTSIVEGFPNALCEAMACGLPVISFDCPSGPAEIVRDGFDGLLLPNQDLPALIAAMDSLMGDPQKRCRLSEHAPEIIERFHLEGVLADWEQVLSEVHG